MAKRKPRQAKKRGAMARIARTITAPLRWFFRSIAYFAGTDEIAIQVRERLNRYRGESTPEVQAEAGQRHIEQRMAVMTDAERLLVIEQHTRRQHLACAALWMAVITAGYSVASHQVLSGLAAATWTLCMTVLSGKHAWAVHVVKSRAVVPFVRWLLRNLDQPFWPVSREG